MRTVACAGWAILALAIGAGAARAEPSAFEKAESEFIAGHRELAYPLLEALCAKPDAPVKAWLYKGVIERDRAELEKGQRTLAEGARRFPDDSPILVELGVTYEWDSKFEDALHAYEQALALDPKNEGAGLGRARVLGFKGERRSGISAYGEFIANHPGNKDAIEGLKVAREATLWEVTARGAVLFRFDSTNITASGTTVKVANTSVKPVPIGSLRLSYMQSDRLTFFGQVREDGPSGIPVGGYVLLVGEILSGDVGVMIKPARGWDLSVGYHFQSAEVSVDQSYQGSKTCDGSATAVPTTPSFPTTGTTQVPATPPTPTYCARQIANAIAFDASYKLSSAWIAMGGARPGIDANGNIQELSRIGIQRMLGGSGAYALFQYYDFRDTDGSISVVPVLAVSAPIWSKLSLKATEAFGWHWGPKTVSVGYTEVVDVEAMWAVSSREEWILDYEFLTGILTHHVIGLTLRYRF